MVRTLFASLALSASIAAACPGSDCSDAKDAPALLSVNAPADKAAGSCSGDKAAAAATSGSAPADKAGTCAGGTTPTAGTCSTEGKSLTLVSASADGAQANAETCNKGNGPGASAVSYASYMPKMGYKVGDQTTTCAKTAGAMASEAKTEMHFMVNGAEFASKDKAMMAHAKQLEGMMMDLVRVQYAVGGECVTCPDKARSLAASSESKTLQYKVGPAIFDNAEDAIKASIMAYNAVQKVNVEYAVGDEITTCSKTAGEMANAANSSVEYVVNGQRTPCDKTAAYMKTLASVESALKALEAAAAGA